MSELGELVIQCRKVSWKEARRATKGGCTSVLIAWLFAILCGVLAGIFLTVLVASEKYFPIVLGLSWLFGVPMSCYVCYWIMSEDKRNFLDADLSLHKGGIRLNDRSAIVKQQVQEIPFEQIRVVVMGEHSATAKGFVKAAEPILQLAALVGAPTGRLANQAQIAQRNRLSIVLHDETIIRFEKAGFYFDRADLAILLDGVNDYLASQQS